MTTFTEKLRKKHNLTQEYLAGRLSISRPTYMQLERGVRDLTVPEAKKLAEIFNLTLDDFLNEVETRVLIEVEPSSRSEVSKKTETEIRISIPQEKLDKFKQILLYLLKKVGGKPNIGMTALYKLLYFIDFDYYEKHEEQLMGLRYIKNHYGPTPIVFDKVIQEMLADNQIERIKSKYYQHDQTKYLINPEVDPDLSVINGQEQEHIDWEIQRLSDLNATTLSDFSHKDVPWLSAKSGDALDYEAVFYRTADTSVRCYFDNVKEKFMFDTNIYDELVKTENKDLVTNLACLVDQKKFALFTTDIIVGELIQIPDCGKKNAVLALLKDLQIRSLNYSAILSGKYQTENGKAKELNGSTFSMSLSGEEYESHFDEHFGEKTSISKKKDAHIFATVREYRIVKKQNLILVTNNIKDFQNKDLSIINFCDFSARFASQKPV